MMVRFRFGRETSAAAVGSVRKESVRAMDRWSLAETVAGLSSRGIGLWTLRFAFGRSAGPAEFATTWFVGGMLGETAVASLGDTSDDRTDGTDDLSANFDVRSEA